MGTYMMLLVALMTLISVATPVDVPLRSKDLVIATEEMIKANYFTFVMLINMSPLDQKIQGNVTFLMPNDRMLAKIRLAQTSISDFLLRHSISSPLLFDQLEHIPSGSMIPSSEPEYMLNIYNKGRKSFFLNNVKIISPNICTAGSSIRCHGIDGVLEATKKPSLPTCSNSTIPAIEATPPAPLPLPAPSVGDFNLIPMSAPSPHQNSNLEKSGSTDSWCLSHKEGLLKFLVSSAIVSILLFFM